MICCYNAARNNPYLEHHHPQYTPLDKVPDSAILEAGLRFSNDRDQKAFRGKAASPPELKKKLG